MAVISFRDALGRGAYLRAGNFLVEDPGIIPYGQPIWQWYDHDTIQVTISYDGGSFTQTAFLDHVGGRKYEIHSTYLYDWRGREIVSAYDIKLRFDINDDFSSGAAFTNVLAGNDIIHGNNFNDYIEGGSGNDTITTFGGDDTIKGQAGNDIIDAGYGNDIIYLDQGNDQIDGSAGRDWIIASGPTAATINLGETGAQFTGFGIDFIRSVENLSGGAGNDVFIGSEIGNFLKGNGGRDSIDGRGGHDILDGGLGADKLNGGAGNDVLYGGLGQDRLTGGEGRDVFVFRDIGESSTSLSLCDVITDFRRGHDKIDLRQIDASIDQAGNNSFTFIGEKEFGVSSRGEVRYKNVDLAGTSRDYTVLYIDNDSDRLPEGTLKILGLHSLTASDFLL